MKNAAILLLLLANIGQTQIINPVQPQPVQVTRILNVTNGMVIDNRSQFVAQNNVVGFCATGTGSWSAALQYADGSPVTWSTPGSISTVTSSSANCIGSYLNYHDFFRFNITGAASVTYTATKNFYQGVLNGNGSGSQGPAGPPIPGKIPVSAYGVNGTSTDAANMQIGLNALAGIGCLYIPAGTTVDMVGNTIAPPSHTCLVGDGVESIMQSSASPGSGGIVQVSGVTDVSITGVHFEGPTTSATGVLYSTAATNGTSWTTFTAGSFIFITGASDQITVKNCIFEHGAGYQVYANNTAGNITNVTLQGNTFKNQRPFLFGTTSGQLVYGSWVGGALFDGPGTTYNYQNITADSNLIQNVTGNGIWFHVTTISVLNQSVRLTNNTCIDTGLDCLQRGITDGLVETGNKSFRNGYVITSDVGASRVGGPMWLQGYVPVAFDNAGYTIHAVIANNVADSENGEGIDGDGLGQSVIMGNKVTSCFASPDPLASASTCGPYTNPSTPVCPGSAGCKGSGVGQNNFVRGMSTSNSSGINNGKIGWNLNISGNEFDGVGGGGVESFEINSSTITGNLIQQPEFAYSDPIVLGNLGTSQWQHSNGNSVTNNTVIWSPPAGSPAVLEDGASACTCPFFSSDLNIVKQNATFGGNLYEFSKDVNDNSGTAMGWFSSVTAGAPVATGMEIQAEGILSTNLIGRFYLQYNGLGEGQVFTMATWASYPPTMNYSAQSVSASTATVGALWSCNDCIPGSSPAVGGGTGCLVYGDGANWNCLSPGITGTGTATHYAMWNSGGRTLGSSGVYETLGVLYTPSGIVSGSGVQATGFNTNGGSCTGQTINVGLYTTAGVTYFVNTAVGNSPTYTKMQFNGGVLCGLTN